MAESPRDESRENGRHNRRRWLPPRRWITVAKWVLAVATIAAIAFVASSDFRPFRDLFNSERRQYGPDVTWVPAPEIMVDKMLDMAQVTSQDHVIDLGSGDGRIVIAAAKKGARAVGIEYDSELIKWSEQSAAEAGVSNKTNFITADFFESDFSQATVITMFLSSRINRQLRPKLLELKPGSRIVSLSFDMGEWEPDERVKTTEGCDQFCEAYLWIVPANVEGNWVTPEGELKLKQTFQMVTGTMTTGARQVSIADGRLRGDELQCRMGDVEYIGRVDGALIEGVMKRDGKEADWSARKTLPVDRHEFEREQDPTAVDAQLN